VGQSACAGWLGPCETRAHLSSLGCRPPAALLLLLLLVVGLQVVHGSLLLGRGPHIHAQAGQKLELPAMIWATSQVKGNRKRQAGTAQQHVGYAMNVDNACSDTTERLAHSVFCPTTI
jgi:hypothetical protein